MIGGPTDVVVEPNIVRAVRRRATVREPASLPLASNPPARPMPEASKARGRCSR